ncbi:MAG: alginate O-acetyltransferase AlgX-related protein [Myxococcota bacterium]
MPPASRPRPPHDLPRRLAIALAVLVGPTAVWAAGLPREIYVAAFGLGGAVAAWGLLRGPGGAFASVALATGVLTVSLAAGDLLLRPVLAPRLYPRPLELLSRRWPPNPDLSRYPAGVRFDGMLHGDIAGMTGREEDREPRHVVWSTDARGFRNPPPPPEGPLDVVLLGDSFAAGSSTHDDELWVSQLREVHGLAALSLGVPGSPWGELLTLKSEAPGLALRPGTTIVWSLFTGNDLDDRYRDYTDVPEANDRLERTSVRFESFRKSSPLRRLWKARTDARLTVERAARDAGFLWVREYAERAQLGVAEIEAHPNHPRLVRVFAAMAAFAGERDLPVLVVVVPTKWETYAWWIDPAGAEASADPSGFARAARRLARDHGFAFLDLKPPLVDAARRAWQEEERFVWWRDDTHWNGRGQAVAAAAVVPLLSRRAR